MKQTFGVIVLALLIFLMSVSSCAINSNMMFKTPKDGSFVYDSIPLKPVEDYKISIDDRLTFNLRTNNGKSLIEGLSGTVINLSNENNSGSNNVLGVMSEYIVRSDGYVEFPVLGDVYVKDLTIKECEDSLESLFNAQYQEPFVQLRVTNRRCVVFSGDGSAAKIITLSNLNTTLLEVLALSGGISPRGKSKLVKVMRKVGDKREIYQIDISTIDGLKYADMIIQGNDYIYVDPRPEIIQGALKEWSTVASLVSSFSLIFTIIRYSNNIKN